MANIEEAAAAFVDDMRQLEREYSEEAKQRLAGYEAVKSECEARMREADREKWEQARELNANYTERIRDAARRRASRSDECAEDINTAAAAVMGYMGGPCKDEFMFNADVARARIEAAAKRREDAEEHDRVTARGRGGIIFL